jgi:hypothetical protein
MAMRGIGCGQARIVIVRRPGVEKVRPGVWRPIGRSCPSPFDFWPAATAPKPPDDGFDGQVGLLIALSITYPPFPGWQREFVAGKLPGEAAVSAREAADAFPPAAASLESDTAYAISIHFSGDLPCPA